MKADGRLARCALKGPMGPMGDAAFAVFAVLCGCGHNSRRILAHLRALPAHIIAAILDLVRPVQDRQQGYAAA